MRGGIIMGDEKYLNPFPFKKPTADQIKKAKELFSKKKGGSFLSWVNKNMHPIGIDGKRKDGKGKVLDKIKKIAKVALPAAGAIGLAALAAHKKKPRNKALETQYNWDISPPFNYGGKKKGRGKVKDTLKKIAKIALPIAGLALAPHIVKGAHHGFKEAHGEMMHDIGRSGYGKKRGRGPKLEKLKQLAKIGLPIAAALAYGTHNAYKDRFHGNHTKGILSGNDLRNFGRGKKMDNVKSTIKKYAPIVIPAVAAVFGSYKLANHHLNNIHDQMTPTGILTHHDHYRGRGGYGEGKQKIILTL